jgi:hypothetical protein
LSFRFLRGFLRKIDISITFDFLSFVTRFQVLKIFFYSSPKAATKRLCSDLSSQALLAALRHSA